MLSDVDELVAAIAALPIGRLDMVPELLAKQPTLVLLNGERLQEALGAGGAQPAGEPGGITVARIWLGLLSLMADAFWVRDEHAAGRSGPAPPALSAFGRQF